jgi:hypothetical protein
LFVEPESPEPNHHILPRHRGNDHDDLKATMIIISIRGNDNHLEFLGSDRFEKLAIKAIRPIRRSRLSWSVPDLLWSFLL